MKKILNVSQLHTVILALIFFLNLNSASAQNWSVNGNGNNISATNFLGTTSLQSLKFRTNDVQRMVITQTGQVGIGVTNPTHALHTSGSVKFESLSGVGSRLLQTGPDGVLSEVSGGAVGQMLVKTLDGLAWADGARGATGPAGANGRDGINGRDGANGANGPAGANGRDGAQGATGATGATGVAGKDGAMGPMGPQGPAGVCDCGANQLISNSINSAFSASKRSSSDLGENFQFFVKTVKEQQVTIETQKETIDLLTDRLNRLESAFEQLLEKSGDVKNLKNSIKLEQNVPNPFNGKALIAYEMPKNMGKPQIIITDLSGKRLRTIQLSDNSGTVEVLAKDLSDGILIYSLVADGKVLKTNKMVITKE
jgi:hypothetical protein